MANKRSNTEAQAIGKPELSPTKAAQLLRKHAETGAELVDPHLVNKDAYSTWVMVARNYLEKAFGKNSPNISAIVDVGRYGAFPMHADEQWWERRRTENLRTQLAKLGGLIELLDTEAELQEQHIVAQPSGPLGHRIFLVHGHDEGILHETARFLETLDQEVVILREQPNQGRTIVEKFEEYADVGFTVVLLTPDDQGGTRSMSLEELRPRARQNVVFELGYFIGRLGRNRVCALYRGGLEMPSDYSGVLYIELDDRGAWRLQLAKELRAAGLPVDMNKAL